MIGLARTACDEGVIRSSSRAAASCAERAKPWILAATILGSSMAFIDGSVVSVALPAIQASLNTSVRGAQWIANAYMLTLGALILVGGAAGDRYGRRRMFSLGIVIFVGASIACGLAPNVATLVAARGLQGIGGAMMVPESLAIISASFPEKERGRAIGTWAGFSALTTALGPVLGGWLVDASSWRTIFFLNVPLGVLALAIAWWHVPESRDDSGETGVDWIGGLCATLALSALAYGLTVESELGWSHPIVLTAVLGSAPVFAVFVWWEARTRTPMMPLALFRSKEFSGANLLTLLLYFALAGAMFFVPFNLIGIQGYSATQAGAAFLPFTLIMGGLSRWSGALVERYDPRLPLTIGPIVVMIGLVLTALPGIGQSYWTGYFPAMSVLGLGMAIAVAPLTTVVMRAAGEKHSGVASGINNATARVAGMLAVALLGAIAAGDFKSSLDRRLTEAHVSTDIHHSVLGEASKLTAAKVPSSVREPERQRVTQLLHESFLHSFRLVMLISAALALLGAIAIWVTLPASKGVAKPRQFRFRVIR
jgi:EmrB/QacA subfamily drug resistance transporter